MASSRAMKRLMKEYEKISKSPVEYIIAAPSPENFLEWHYVLTGPADTPYVGGTYWGTLLFKKEYPFKPPSIYIMTPNGRFETDKRLCLSMSDYHPETWNPGWTVASILKGLLSFMLEETPTLGSVPAGSIGTTLAERKRLADASMDWNAKNGDFCKMFPFLVEGHASADGSGAAAAAAAGGEAQQSRN